MARTYAGILGLLGLLTSLARGFLHGQTADAMLLTGWLSLLVLVSKPWMSKRRLASMAASRFWRTHPRALARLAGLSNAAFMATQIPGALHRGEVGPRLVRRFLTPGSWITA